MRVLLDSHVALWWLDENAALGPDCRAAIEDADEVLVSVVTPWELGIKRALGKLTFPDGLVEALRLSGIGLLAIAADHAERAPELPAHHRDPFDRILVAQAELESLVLVTADRQLDPYAISRLDAQR